MPDYSLPPLGGQIPFQSPGYANPYGLAGLAPMGQAPTYGSPVAAGSPSGGMPFASGGGGMSAMAGDGALFGLINGIGQLLKSKRMHPQRPEYEIPQETQDILGLRENLLNAEMPGEVQARQDIATNQADAMSSAARGSSDQSQFLSLLGVLQRQSNNSYNNLATQHAANYYQNVGGLENAQRGMAAARDKEWELNKYDPYLMQLQRKYQLQNAGNQNIESGISSITSMPGTGGGSGGGGGMGGLMSLLPMLA